MAAGLLDVAGRGRTPASAAGSRPSATTRVLGQLPYGPGAAPVHVEGSPRAVAGSGRRAHGAAPVRRGHTCVELNEADKISRLTAIYDSSLTSYAAYQFLAGLAAEAPPS